MIEIFNIISDCLSDFDISDLNINYDIEINNKNKNILKDRKSVV